VAIVARYVNSIIEEHVLATRVMSSEIIYIFNAGLWILIATTTTRNAIISIAV
jgi:hypothetical protein